jgi:hypothetical protein
MNEAMMQGRKDSLILILESRFGELPESIEAALMKINQRKRLDELIKKPRPFPRSMRFDPILMLDFNRIWKAMGCF